jgi:hypothetical protein
MTEGCNDCTGCQATVDIQGTIQVPAGGNYTLSGVQINGTPMGSDNQASIHAPGPSGSRFVISDADGEQAIVFPDIIVKVLSGDCKLVDSNCVEATKCKPVSITMPVPKAALSDGDMGFRINGGAVQLAGEETFSVNGNPQFSQFDIPLTGNDMACGGSDLVVEIEYCPNNSTLPLPAGYSNWTTGMKVTIHCAKCVGTEDPI